MTFFMNMILNMVANAAEGAAIFSVGTASLGGMEPAAYRGGGHLALRYS